MRKSMALLCASALAAFVLTGTAHANPIKWSYGASSFDIYNTNNPAKTSSVSFIGASNNVEGDSGIIVYRLVTVWDPLKSGSAGVGPDSFDGVNSSYDLAITITDTKSQQSDTFHFLGRFKGGNFTPTSFSASKEAFSWDSPTLQTKDLGDNTNGFRTYTIDITSSTPPGAPGDPGGAIYADVSMKEKEDNNGGGGGGEEPPPPSEAPEPATMAMAAIGLPVMFALRRRFKKKS